MKNLPPTVSILLDHELRQRAMRGLDISSDAEEREIARKVGANPKLISDIRRRALKKCMMQMNSAEL